MCSQANIDCWAKMTANPFRYPAPDRLSAVALVPRRDACEACG